MLGALNEPGSTAVLLIVFGFLAAFSVLFSRTFERLGVPIVLLFLILGMVGGSEGPGGLWFDDYQFAARVGTMALVFILFDGGLNTSASSVRQVLAPAGLLATLGVALTAGILALCGMALGLPWQQALLLGAVVSSTDAAAVFAVLRGGKLQLQPKVGRTLEVESCINDPMAVILTLTVIQVMQAGGANPWTVVLMVPVQLVVGAGIGLALGYLGSMLIRKVHVGTVGLLPALTLSLAFLSFGIATLAQGSGFLSVFLTALILGNRQLPYRSGLARVHDAIAWLSQIAMFTMLGLLVFPSRLVPVAGTGLGLGLMLAFVARPLAVLACLFPFRYPARQVLYLSWVGLRGAVPIILATFPVLAGVNGAQRIFDLVFFIVVVSTLIPGATIRVVTRRLGLNTPSLPPPEAALEINSAGPLDGQITSYRISPDLVVCNSKLSDIAFPVGSSVLLVVRGRQIIAARGSTELLPGDHVHVFHKEEDRPLLELLFGSPEVAG